MNPPRGAFLHFLRFGPLLSPPGKATWRASVCLGTCISVSTMTVAVAWYNDWYMKDTQQIYKQRIVTDPRILAGKPVIKGTRIGVNLVLEELAQNPDITELLAAHPDLTRADVQACLSYAKDIVSGEEVSPKPPKGARSDAAL